MRHVVFEEELRAALASGARGFDAAVSCHLDLGIACNLACEGCPGRAPGAVLNDEERALLGEQVLRRARSQAAGVLRVAFHGGEPLLESDLVLGLSRRIRAAAAREGIRYEGLLLTNGTLLGEDVSAKSLASAGIERVQVTLEAGRERHDQLRHTPDGRGTFRRIVANLKRARSHVDVVVRTHGGPAATGLEALAETLAREGLFEGPRPITLFVASPAPYLHQSRDLVALFATDGAARAGRLQPGSAEPS